MLCYKVARGSATAAVLIGLISFDVSIHGELYASYTRDTFRRLSLGLLVVTRCESLIFMLMGSAGCHANPDNLPPNVILEECRLNTGSVLTLSVIILWFGLISLYRID
jgi:hypothetical protein